ncbi:MAG TPA: plastocyanin/azurin family copper-binding protein [Phycisphaerae bacterium]|nr:plastocyanin/azurin family copper-binding protein [Phycisphaerae bacterium]
MFQYEILFRGIRWSSGAFFVMVFLVVSPLLAQPHANVPLPIPEFSIDRESPSTNSSRPPSAVLKKPGPMILYPGANLGLIFPMDDELQDFSYNRTGAAGQKPSFLLLFSVDRMSQGARPPDSGLTSTGRCFNVMDQANRHQSAADLYLTLDDFTLAGPVGPKSGGRAMAKNNTLGVNQWDTGGVDEDLSPTTSPEQHSPTTQPADEIDGVGYPSGGGTKDRNTTFYYTVDPNSPSLPLLPGVPGQQSGADIFMVPNPANSGFPPEVYAPAQSLGLLPTRYGDDIAALVVFDNGNGVLNPGVDEILFTLARGSPSLALHQVSPADILVSRGNGSFYLWAEADILGLLPSDHVNALEIIPTDNPAATVYDHAIFRVWPGDYDGNGILNQADCAAFPGCYSGPGISYDTNGVAIHTVLVGPGPVFNPSTIHVEVGDTVRWIWADGPHSVVSGMDGVPDGMFSSGTPSFPPRMFEVTFDAAVLDLYPRSGWIYPYFSAPDTAVGMIGFVVVHAPPCSVFDLDFDGDVDCTDWQEFQPVYHEATGGGSCMPLGIPEFVAALLGTPMLPGHVCLADMNGDGQADGLDVQPYLDEILP